MRRCTACFGLFLAVFAPFAAADPEVRNNLVKPIYGPGPVRTQSTPAPCPPESPDSVSPRKSEGAEPAPSVVPGQARSGRSRTFQGNSRPIEVPWFGRPAEANRVRRTHLSGADSRYIANIADSRSTFWGLEPARCIGDPGWRGEDFVSRPAWDFGSTPRFVKAAWWTFAEQDFTLGCGSCGERDFDLDYVTTLPRQARSLQIGSSLSAALEREVALSRSVVVMPGSSGQQPGPSSGSDNEWTDPPGVVRSGILAARPRRDVRPEVRRIVSLTLDTRYLDAIDSMRRAVIEKPEAFTARHGDLLGGDAATQQRLEAALVAYQTIPARGSAGELSVSDVDASFMAAALHALRGEHEPALAAIRVARELGESRPSGKALYRVLARATPAEAGTTVTAAAPERAGAQP